MQEKEKKKERNEARLKEIRGRREEMTEEEVARWREECAQRVRDRIDHRKEKHDRLRKSLECGQRILVDLDFVDLMTPSEVRSIVHQMLFCYGANAKAENPCHLMLTSVTGIMKESMARQIPTYTCWSATVSPLNYLELLKNKDDLVYLTADSDTEIKALDSSKVYIVGGLVDRNRHKGVCLKKAQEQGIATARLPIGEYVQLASHQVMCTNHVVEMLIKWGDVKDWEIAFKSVIPTRKRKNEDDNNHVVAST